MTYKIMGWDAATARARDSSTKTFDARPTRRRVVTSSADRRAGR
jgi:hypothetical protein